MAGGKVYEIGGSDAESFLQGLVSNDLARLKDGLVYAALLSPQGKYLADFFLARRGDAILLDVAPVLAAATVQRLGMYRLRADVTIAESELSVIRTGDPEGALADPRHPSLGHRRYGPPGPDELPDPLPLRVAHCIPESGVELIPNESYILECGFERLHGVDFRKGCYVGQEVTARMKHKTELRKGLVTVEIEGAAPVGTEILAGGKPAGVLFSQHGGQAIAYLRHDRAGEGMRAGDAVVNWRG
ncbi:CAF17-like 4Fe-4S cluster assembly/insertion protein YgfZ [Frigidibacter sp. ROC022]|uniref:CAF17-like 4Fe-4S cluster assembly/insertion protein YgfZ n=1 Tax=Frigidibacter sp. ROC022 TaxID=2971796 RepID=UPI00215A110D|nr:folate-binding protein [Frigidibacter sp. ROC022]MCR8722957.1 folate-binding protein [Frigidibacter sp. ROC022]